MFLRNLHTYKVLSPIVVYDGNYSRIGGIERASSVENEALMRAGGKFCSTYTAAIVYIIVTFVTSTMNGNVGHRVVSRFRLNDG